MENLDEQLNKIKLNSMKIFKNWFLIKRPKESVLQRSAAYETGKLFEIKEFYMDKKGCAKYGFEDGYLQCLKDLGIDHTINGHVKTKTKRQ